MKIFPAIIKPATFILLLQHPVSVLAQDNQLGQENYIQADVNKDGVLDYAEFVTFIDLNAADNIGRAKMISSGGFHERGFKRVDRNGDGYVTPNELQAISQ